MSDTTNTSDHWGQQFIDCLVRKAKNSFKPGKVIDEKHVLIDHIESNAVEDASENLDSIKKIKDRKPMLLYPQKGPNNKLIRKTMT